MTRDELVDALTVERFAPQARLDAEHVTPASTDDRAAEHLADLAAALGVVASIKDRRAS